MPDTLLLCDGLLTSIEVRLLETGESEALRVAAPKKAIVEFSFLVVGIDDDDASSASLSALMRPPAPTAPLLPRSLAESRGQGIEAPCLNDRNRGERREVFLPKKEHTSFFYFFFTKRKRIIIKERKEKPFHALFFLPPVHAAAAAAAAAAASSPSSIALSPCGDGGVEETLLLLLES